MSIDEQVQGKLSEGLNDEAFALLLGAYGEEIAHFIKARVNGAVEQEDIYQQWCFNVWSYLPRFEFKSTLRTWIYRIARGCISEQMERKQPRERLIQETSELVKVPAKLLRTQTDIWMKTDTKNKLWELCGELETEDQEILLLRIRRKMSWGDIALVLSDSEALPREQQKKDAARLRKRFERLKEDLRERLTQVEEAG